MAPQDSPTTPRFDSLHELLTQAQQLGLSVTMNVHGVPQEKLMGWLQEGLLDTIELGPDGNPPTGTLEAGRWGTGEGRTEVSAFMEDDRERQRRINREEDARIGSAEERA